MALSPAPADRLPERRGQPHGRARHRVGHRPRPPDRGGPDLGVHRPAAHLRAHRTHLRHGPRRQRACCAASTSRSPPARSSRSSARRLRQVDAAAPAGGLDRPTDGQRARSTARPSRGIDPRCAVAFQEPRLLPWRTIARERRPRPAARHPARRRRRARVAELLELVGLAELAGHRPREVSGGMAQRASLARALARNPGVLLLDEPFGALDALTRLRMQDLLLDVHAAEPTTVLLVTHDVDEALHLADRVVLLGARRRAEPGALVRRIVDVPGHPAARPRRRRARRAARRPARRPRRRPPPAPPAASDHAPASRTPVRRAATAPRPTSPTMRTTHVPHPVPPIRRSSRRPPRAAAAHRLRRRRGPAAAPRALRRRRGRSASAETLNIDFATYNPLSLVIKDQGWLEDALARVT